MLRIDCCAIDRSRTNESVGGCVHACVSFSVCVRKCCVCVRVCVCVCIYIKRTAAVSTTAL